ncbi:hypothetical protein ACFV0D_12610 [Streptomyces sp. NPDC059556]|uniref:hypothetical protein n=1 Tax=Streptomyces sp. NPDC059556 TaxID=3346863 RepID=UPI0036B6A226
MGDTYGPIESMAEQVARKDVREPCTSTFETPAGETLQCEERWPHPYVVCHSGEWVWGQ